MTLLELLQLMRKHLKLMIVLPIVCALATALVCFVALPNTYTASTSMYVLAKQSSANSDNAANYSNLNASQMMANDVSTLLKSDRIEADTAKDLHLESLKGYSTKVTSETTSRVITLSVTGTDPDIAATIANDMASNVSKVAQQVMDVQSVNVIDQATAPTAPSGPNRPMYIAVALLAGLFVAIAIVVVQRRPCHRVLGHARVPGRVRHAQPHAGRHARRALHGRSVLGAFRYHAHPAGHRLHQHREHVPARC